MTNMERYKIKTANYTLYERQLLMKLTSGYRSLLESDLVSTGQKSKIWHAIQLKFNKSVNVFPRTAKQLKCKYGTIRREMKHGTAIRGQRPIKAESQTNIKLENQSHSQNDRADARRAPGRDTIENKDALRYVKVNREQPSTSYQQTSVPSQNNTLADIQRISMEKAMKNEHKLGLQLKEEHDLRVKNLKLKHEVLSLKKEVLELQRMSFVDE